MGKGLLWDGMGSDNTRGEAQGSLGGARATGECDWPKIVRVQRLSGLVRPFLRAIFYLFRFRNKQQEPRAAKAKPSNN